MRAPSDVSMTADQRASPHQSLMRVGAHLSLVSVAALVRLVVAASAVRRLD